MREFPILFSAPMVLALLAGRKTQTRRIPPRELWDHEPSMLLWGRQHYGEPGDLLYVREAWRTGVSLDGQSPVQICKRGMEAGYPTPWAPIKYEAGGPGDTANSDTLASFGGQWGRYRHARFMPKPLSRIRRRRTDQLRVERLQRISEADILAEGLTPDVVAEISREPLDSVLDLRGAFQVGWDAINGDRVPWHENPPVIVVSHAAHDEERAA